MSSTPPSTAVEESHEAQNTPVAKPSDEDVSVTMTAVESVKSLDAGEDTRSENDEPEKPVSQDQPVEEASETASKAQETPSEAQPAQKPAETEEKLEAEAKADAGAEAEAETKATPYSIEPKENTQRDSMPSFYSWCLERDEGVFGIEIDVQEDGSKVLSFPAWPIAELAVQWFVDAAKVRMYLQKRSGNQPKRWVCCVSSTRQRYKQFEDCPAIIVMEKKDNRIVFVRETLEHFHPIPVIEPKYPYRPKRQVDPLASPRRLRSADKVIEVEEEATEAAPESPQVEEKPTIEPSVQPEPGVDAAIAEELVEKCTKLLSGFGSQTSAMSTRMKNLHKKVEGLSSSVQAWSKNIEKKLNALNKHDETQQNSKDDISVESMMATIETLGKRFDFVASAVVTLAERIEAAEEDANSRKKQKASPDDARPAKKVRHVYV